MNGKAESLKHGTENTKNIKDNYHKDTKSKGINNSGDVKNSTHATRYLIIGTCLALFNYGSYAILANLIIKNNDLIWLSTFIATAATTILAYILHSKITWKERPVTKTAIYKFFIWNILLTILINPLLTQLFSYITPLYEWGFNILQNLHIPFTYEFTLTTGAFVLTAIVTTIMNYLLYDKFVFGKAEKQNSNKTKSKQ